MRYAPPTPLPPFVSVILKLTVCPWSTLMFVAKPCRVMSPAPPTPQTLIGVPPFEFSHVITFQPGLLQGSKPADEPDEYPIESTAATATPTRSSPRSPRNLRRGEAGLL